jgi:hypothetical protein
MTLMTARVTTECTAVVLVVSALVSSDSALLCITRSVINVSMTALLINTNVHEELELSSSVAAKRSTGSKQVLINTYIQVHYSKGRLWYLDSQLVESTEGGCSITHTLSEQHWTVRTNRTSRTSRDIDR